MPLFVILFVVTFWSVPLTLLGVHWSWDISPLWATTLPLIAGFVLLLIMREDFNPLRETYEGELLGDILASMMCGGFIGPFGAPVMLVLTGSWLVALSFLMSGIALLLAMFMFGLLVERTRKKGNVMEDDAIQ